MARKTTQRKLSAVGSLLIESGPLTEKRGGKQKLRRIVGENIFYQGYDKKRWFWNNRELFKLRVEKIEKLVEIVKNS